MNAPHVLVIDDHAIVRLGVRQLLGAGAVLHEAADIASALALLAQQPIELALLDLNLGDQFSLGALPRLRDARPGLKVIVLTSMDETLHAERALRAGADGYVMKSELAGTLTQAIRQVLAGEVYVSAAQRNQLLRKLARPAAETRPELSTREVEVLRLVAAGKSTREIADALNRSVKTIETHKQTLKTKLGADNPAMLVRRAVEWFGEGG